MMTNKELDFFEELNIHAWYSELSNDFMCEVEEMLEKPSRKEIEQVLDKFGYCYKYQPESKIYCFITIFDGIEFNCNPELRRGMVRVSFFAKNLKTGRIVGSQFSVISRMMEIMKGQDSGAYIRNPRYRNYEELYQILERVFNKYEEFKVAAVKQGIMNEI